MTNKTQNILEIFEQAYKDGFSAVAEPRNQGNTSPEINISEAVMNAQRFGQNYDFKDRMFNWIISMSSFYLVIVLIIFFLTVFKIKQEFLEGINLYILISILIIPSLFAYFILQIIQKSDKLVNNSKSDSEKRKTNDNKLKSQQIIVKIILGCLVGFIYLMLSKIIDMRPAQEINSSIIIALITSTTGTVIALPALVAKIIFDDKNKSNL